METDTNPYLIGCANGILDLEGLVFREGEVDENVTFKMGRCPDMDAIPYIPYETVCDNPIYEEINDFFAKLFLDEEVRTYMWRLLASCLKGKNDEQEFYNWVGAGGNGKSKLAWLMQITFGDYARSLSTTVLTRKQSAEAPEITGIRKKRFIYMCEPDENEPLNQTMINQLCTAVMGKTFMMSNTNLTIDGDNNIHVVPFTSRFVYEGHPQFNPEQNIFHTDAQLEKKLPQWRTYFFSKLVHIYKTEYSTHGLGSIA